MDNISSTVAESVTGTRHKIPLAPETAGVLSAGWQQLAPKAKQAENDMHEAAEGAPAAFAESDIQDAAKDIIEASRRSRQKTHDHRRSKQAAVSPTVTSQRSSSKSHNNIEMEF